MQKPTHNNMPEYYALTDAQAVLLDRFKITLEEITPKYTELVDDKPVWKITPELIKELLSALRRKRISFDVLSSLADEILSKHWYTLIIAGDVSTKDHLLYYLLTSESQGKSILVSEDNEFYTLNHSSPIFPASDKDYKREREILGLSDDHKFLFSVEHYYLGIIVDIKAVMDAPEDAEGNWIIKSSPIFTPFVFSGKRNASAGRMENRGNTIYSLSGGNVKWSINAEFTAFGSNKRAQDLYDYFVHLAAMSGYNSTCVYTDTKEIKKLWNVSDNKNFTEQLLNALRILDNAKISGKTYRGDFDNKKISQDSSKYSRGKLIFYFTDEWLEIIKSTKENLVYSPLIQALPVKNYSKPITRKFYENMRIKAGEPDQNRLSVKSLLAVTDLPDITDLERASQASQRIIKPFNDSLEDIKNFGIFSYKYTKVGGKKLSPQEEKQAKTDYFFWSGLVVEISNIAPVNYTILNDRKAARKEIAEKEEQQQQKRKRGRPRKTDASPTGNQA